MTLTVTPGGATDDAYAVLAAIKAKWDTQGRVYTSVYDDNAIEQAARIATVWLDGEYEFPGDRTTGRTQALEWPRSGVVDRDGNTVDSDELPREIVAAMIEATWHQLTGTTLSPVVTPGENVRSERVGSIAVEYAGASGSIASQKPVLTAVDAILSALFPINRGTGFLKRA